ncbi:MAG TPA: phosphoribosylformylglycinamidine synthase I [Microscillaceae bacterium]|jgi:phosphoribosylformylglycinamidine synthase|nr:phosphoribosylformylglycinamidine synthase I [Microscillaceae bacterium]
MKFGILVFPGSNCDDDMLYVLRDILNQQVTKIWHKDRDLQGCEVVVVPGGFSYGDYLRSGAIARFSPVMQAVVEHAQRGRYVWGICNGFQILTEAGLLDGALLKNNHQKYTCKNIYLQVGQTQSALTKQLDPKRPYRIPIAHGDGRFFASSDVLKRLEDNDQILFRYCDAQGLLTDESNPNGSTDHIAGICNKQGNIWGMMPHPERACDPLLGNTDGRFLFESLLHQL